MDYLVKKFELESVLDRKIEELSGGELQRFAICVVCTQDADVYMFDEASSFLDIKQRMTATEVRNMYIYIYIYIREQRWQPSWWDCMYHGTLFSKIKRNILNFVVIVCIHVGGITLH